MKNLIHLTESRQLYEPRNSNDFIKCLISNPNAIPDEYDNSNPSHYILSPSGQISAVSLSNQRIWSFNLSQITGQEDGEEGDLSWFHLSYDENSDMLVALSHSGCIVSIDPYNNTEGNGELIGKFDHGIACAAWSADGEVLALVTYSMIEKQGNHDVDVIEDEKVEQLLKVPTLMTMNTQFEILAEVNLPPISDKEDESMIDICWNRKYDNALIAVSCHDIDDNLRKVRIFKGDTLELSAMSRTEDGSGKPIPNIMGISEGSLMAWAGSNTSNLLACVQKKGKRGRNVIFLEPNGLQHGGFKLDQRQNGEEVIGLNWNAESDILAVTLIGESKYGKLQFYHRSNYHWYLKNEILYEEGVSISAVEFDKIRPYEVSIGLHDCKDLRNNGWRQYTYAWDTATIASRSGAAFVVDGCHLNLSMFQRAIIPPPMYSNRLSFESSILSVAQNPLNHGSIDFAVHLSNGTVAICKSGSKAHSNGNCSEQLSLINLKSLLSSTPWDTSCLRQLLIINAVDESNDSVLVDFVAILCSKALCNEPETVIRFKVNISLSENDSVSLVSHESSAVEGKVLRIVNWSIKSDDDEESFEPGALLELTDGSLFEISIDQTLAILPCQSEPMFLEPCPWIAGLRDSGEGRHIVVGLSSRYRLYCGERQLCDASSSFYLSPSSGFLSYVTLGSRSQLRFLPLNILSTYDPLMGSDENLEVVGEGYEPRNVERGSRLVSILPDKITALLQLPRGNLEAVYPRALLLPRIMTLIDSGEYHLALDMMRRQKVDMNLIVDMNPSKFLERNEGIERMLRKVERIDHLNLFIASLSNFDFTVAKYPVPKWLNRIQEEKHCDVINSVEFDYMTKVNQVCEKLREVMINIESNNISDESQFLLPILSTFAKQEPPKLEDALSLIKENALKQPSSSNAKNVLLLDKAQSSIQYLAFLADYELLFDTALGMYDFDLAKAVARNSQMDPKVYLPMLKRLNNLPKYESRYEVDIRLKRYESALRHLYQSKFPADSITQTMSLYEDQFQECMNFIEKHKLHQLGLELFINNSQWHRKILISMGESLLSEQKDDLALAIFLAASPKYYNGAKRAARSSGNWKTFFTYMVEDPDTAPDEIKSVATSIADDVSSGRGGLYGRRERKEAAARILLDYCNDTHGAIDMLTAAELWFEARRIATLYDESYMMKGIIDAAIVYAQTCISDFEEKAENFCDASSRYCEVVFMRRQAKRDGEEIVDEENIETGSLFSLATNASNSSVRSNMSSSSVGSVSSLSSVISAGAASTFSVINDHATRHKSKFNNIGKKKKKKKTRRERMSMKPGSEEELNHLISKLKENLIDDDYLETIVESIQFLVQMEKIAIAKSLFMAYKSFKSRITQYQQERIHKTKIRSEELEKEARQEGRFHEKIVLSCEETVDKLCCSDLPQTLETFFSLMIEMSV